MNESRHNAAAPASAVTPIVIRFGRLGDMVLLGPLLNLLHRRYRNPCWLIGAGSWCTELYGGHEDVARIWSLSGRHTPLLLGPTWWRIIWTLRHSGKSPIYVCETSASHALNRIKALLWLARIEPQRCVFLREDDAYAGGHRIDGLLRFGRQTPAGLRSDDYPPVDVVPAPRLKVSHDERLECAAWLDTRGWSGRPIVLVQPGNRRSMRWRPLRRAQIDDKAWPREKWSELLRCVQQSLPQAQIVLCGSRQELSLLRGICRAAGLGQVIGLHLPLRRLLALCEIAHCMISVDTGPAHMAAAVGSPLIVLFGRSSPRHWLPRGVHGSPIVALGGPPAALHVDEIPVRAVVDAWRSLPPRAGAFTAGQLGVEPGANPNRCGTPSALGVP